MKVARTHVIMVKIHFIIEIGKVPTGNPNIKNKSDGTFAKDACKQ